MTTQHDERAELIAWLRRIRSPYAGRAAALLEADAKGGEAVAKEREACAIEAEHWQAISGSNHKCGEYIAAAIRGRAKDKPTLPQAAQVPLTDAELELCRQWFDNVQDVNRAYLEPADYVLAKRIYEHLGMRVNNSIKDGITAQTPPPGHIVCLTCDGKGYQPIVDEPSNHFPDDLPYFLKDQAS